jgi:hypothetical protein
LTNNRGYVIIIPEGNRKEVKKMIKVRDTRDGWTIEVQTMEEAINICVHDWNMEIVEE